jgi:hypothetical protein
MMLLLPAAAYLPPVPPLRAVVVRVLGWFVFVAIIGLAPLALDAFKHGLDGKGFDIDSTLASGELFIVSAVLAAALFAEVFNAAFETGKAVDTVRSAFLILAAAASAILIGLNTGAYALVTPGSSTQAVTSSSFWLYLSTVGSGVATITIATRP